MRKANFSPNPAERIFLLRLGIQLYLRQTRIVEDGIYERNHSNVSERKEELLRAIFQHLAISLSALILAILIAIPLAILLSQKKRMAELFTDHKYSTNNSIIGIIGIIDSFVGIGTVPALIALVVYALLPIFKTRILGFPKSIRRLKKRRMHLVCLACENSSKFELPIAMPVIISGVRTALVLIIGTATWQH